VCRVTQPTNADGELLSGLNTTTGATTWTYTLIAPGTCTLAADQDGLDDDGIPSAFAPTGPITRSITVRSAATTLQYLFLAARDTLVYGDVETFVVTASSRTADDPIGSVTGLPVLLAGSSGVCTVGTAETVDGVTTATVRVIAGGACTIRAEQAGDTTYRAATAITVDVIVTARTVALAGLTAVGRVYDGTLTVALTGAPALSGVVPGDGPVDVGVAGTAAASVPSPSAGEGRTATVTGLTLSGAKVENSYVLAEKTLLVTITQRPVDIDELSAGGREYDGSTTVAVLGTPSPRAQIDSASGRGRVGSDELIVGGTLTAALGAPDAGTFAVTVAGLTLGGAAAANYRLVAPSLSVTITARPITITAQDRSVKTGGTPSCTAAATGLADGDALASVTCTYRDDDDQSRDPAVGVEDDVFRIVLSGPSFVRGGDPVDANNYVVTFAEGRLTIVGLSVPALDFGIDGKDRTFVYGTPLGGRLAVTARDDEGNPVGGTIVSERGDVSVAADTILDVGSQQIVVTFTPSSEASEDFQAITETRTFTVTRRPVTIAAVTAVDRIYDGTTTVAVDLSGASLETATGDTGVILADADDVVIQGASSASVGSADVDVDVPVTVSGLTLGGARRDNYILQPVTGVTVTISVRPLTIAADDLVIAPGDALGCSALGAVEAGEGLVGSEAIDTAACEALVDQAPADLNTPGSADLRLTSVTLNPGKLSNYTITFVPGRLTIAPLRPVIAAATVEFVYGGTLAGRLGWSATSPRGGGVSGVLSQQLTRAGSLVEVEDSEVLEAGAYTLELSFTPENGNRYLPATAQRVVTVTKRTVTVTPVTRFKLVGEPDPTFTALRSGLLAGDADLELDEPIAVGRASGQVGEGVGQYIVRSSGGSHSNYAFAHEDGILHVGAVSVVIPVDGELDRDEPIACACEGLVPGMEVSVSLFSDPVLLGTDTVDENGTCPLLAALIIPEDFPGGDHTLVILVEEGDLDVLDGGPITLSSRVTISDTRTGTTGSDDGDLGGSSDQPPAQATTEADPPGGADPVRGADLSPVRVPGTPATQPATQGNGSGSVPNPGLATGGRSDGGEGRAPVDRTGVTVDLGRRGGTTTIPADASLGVFVAANRALATVDRDALARESFRGFAPSSGIRFEVIGARSTVRFVLTEVDLVDTVVTADVLARSARFQAADFARVTDIRLLGSSPSGAVPNWSAAQRADAEGQFAASRLSQPAMLADIDVSGFTQWIQISGEVAGYLPGSTLHLAVTSQPIVLASVVVGRYGTAAVSGVLPIELLGLGEHRIRFVGTRVFDGLSVDDDGEIRIPGEVLEQIDRFDLGTDATVIAYGFDSEGGSHMSLRIIALDAVPPWWTLLLVLLAGAIGLRSRRRGRLETRGRRSAAAGGVIVAAAPAVVLGWFATTTIVAVVVVAAALLLAAAVLVVRSESQDAASTRGPDDHDLADLEV
jgi:hypothetical protein